MAPETSTPSVTATSGTDLGNSAASFPTDSSSSPSLNDQNSSVDAPADVSTNRDTDPLDLSPDHNNDARGVTPPAKDTDTANQGPVLVRPCAMTEKKKLISSLKDAMDELDRIWNIDGEDDDDNNDELTVEENDAEASTLTPPSACDPVRQTAALLVRAFSHEVYDPAINALTENEELRTRTADLTNQVETNLREIERLRRSEQRSKESIKNLLKAVDRSAEETKDSSQAKLVEAKLRAELLQARKERDAAHHESLVAQRSLELLKGDAEALKKEKIRLQHENLRLEREARSARSLVEALGSTSDRGDNGASTAPGETVDYYKRKARDLETHLQGMTARLAEKNQELRELRHCRDRNRSQNRLEALRACAASGVAPAHKKARVLR